MKIFSNCSVGLRTCCADRNKHRLKGKNPIGEADLEWIFARNCEALNSYNIQMIRMRRGSGRSCGNSAAGIYHARKGMV